MQTQKKVNSITLTDKQAKEYKSLVGVAARIRYVLANVTSSRGDAARLLSELEGREIKYQWVRNVQLTPLKRS